MFEIYDRDELDEDPVYAFAVIAVIAAIVAVTISLYQWLF